MHIASSLALVRRNPAQSKRPTDSDQGAIRFAWVRRPERAKAIRTRVWKILPGVFLLMGLVLLGALYPLLF
jgi:hypothetical protein